MNIKKHQKSKKNENEGIESEKPEKKTDLRPGGGKIG